MSYNYAQLRAALANGPTPGPRSINEVGDSHRIVVRGGSVSGVMAFVETGWPHPEQQSEQRANALLIAAANPETIFALLAERDAQVAEIEQLREAVKDYLQAQDAVDNNEYQSMPEDFGRLNGRRKAARDDLDVALSGEPK
ncbi:hypothetical protein [Alcaligenes ammonioxydans]|uniref:hypothetical protein n=1 Tax=Alcaligenes ammonioxydans TaxID=2582914 RepID=UPI003D192565